MDQIISTDSEKYLIGINSKMVIKTEKKHQESQ